MTLTLPQPTSELLTKARLKTPKEPRSGIDAIYIPLNSKWGVKLFHRAESRDSAFKWAMHLNRLRLAPKVAHPFVTNLWDDFRNPFRDFTYEGRQYRYGFIMQRAVRVGKLSWQEIQRLDNRLHAADLEFPDSHANQYGYIRTPKRYRPVIVDTGMIYERRTF